MKTSKKILSCLFLLFALSQNTNVLAEPKISKFISIYYPKEAFLYGIKTKNSGFLKVILEYATQVRSFVIDVNTRDTSGYDALLVAIENNDFDFASKLIRYAEANGQAIYLKSSLGKNELNAFILAAKKVTHLSDYNLSGESWAKLLIQYAEQTDQYIDQYTQSYIQHCIESNKFICGILPVNRDLLLLGEFVKLCKTRQLTKSSTCPCKN